MRLENEKLFFIVLWDVVLKKMLRFGPELYVKIREDSNRSIRQCNALIDCAKNLDSEVKAQVQRIFLSCGIT